MLTQKRVARIIARARKAKRPMRALDSHGLYLQVSRSGVPSWVLRYSLREHERYMGLGPLHVVDLKLARTRARAIRLMLLDGVDPLERKRAERAAALAAAAKAKTFADCARGFFESHESKWSNAKYCAQFVSSMRSYVLPLLGPLPVDSIDVRLVLSVLEQPIAAAGRYSAGTLWSARLVTAMRVRARLEQVLSWATVRGFRSGDNPARWRGHLDQILPARAAKAQHHPAMPFAEVPQFMVELRALPGVAARALEFTILCAARTGETLGAVWDELDLAAKTWTIPATRMKTRTEHRVPLSSRAIEILRSLEAGPFVFTGVRGGALNCVAMPILLKHCGRVDATVHGFRSSFRDWCEERTSFPAPVYEQALAHKVGSAVERAYRRTTLFEQRAKLMEMWSQFCSAPATPAGKVVVPLRKPKR
jgi:integrase